jgi:hypothetical protein
MIDKSETTVARGAPFGEPSEPKAGSSTPHSQTPGWRGGFYWVTRFLYDQTRLVAPNKPAPEVAMRWQGRWHFVGDETVADEVWMIHSGRLEEPNV